MSREKKKSLSLNYSDFDIAGNVFRAWHDADNNLVFVVDETIDEYKPNVMLIINPDGERKWDDILVNDYDIDLENVRPKKDNKYQKLDIEYDGLDIYKALIQAYIDGADIDNAVSDLIDFRDAAVRRATTSRLNAALEIIDQSNETIARAEKSLVALRDRRRKLRNKLMRQKEKIGREPTKESAGKILRTESQIESNAERLARVQLRIDNANRRIEIANADADSARKLLALRRPGVKKIEKNGVASKGKVFGADKQNKKKTKTVVQKSVTIASNAELRDNNEYSDTGTLPVPDYDLQPRENKMPDSEEVKPLFDKDPEILDDEIAFKPVEFDDIKAADEFDERKLHRPEHTESSSESTDVYSEQFETVSDDAGNLSESREDDNSWDDNNQIGYDNTRTDDGVRSRPLDFSQNDSEYETSNTKNVKPEPVLETITTVEESVPSDVDTLGQVDTAQYASAAAMTRPVSPASMATPASSPVAPTRPISPITGNEPVRPVGERAKPTFAYYLLLILLIALSIFTLWLYQKKNGAVLPELDMAPESMIDTSASPEIPIEENKTTESIVDDVTPESERLQELDIPVILPEINKPIEVRYPNDDILKAAEPDVVVTEPESDVLARKDPYYVSRDDQVVYVPVEPAPIQEQDVRVTTVSAPSVIYDNELVSVPVPAPEYDDAEYYYEDTAAVYQPANAQPVQNEYVEYNEYSGGFVDDGAYTEQYDSSQYYDEYGPQTRRHVDARDGGQYSIIYDETTY